MDMGRPVARHHVRRPQEDLDPQAASAEAVEEVAPPAAEQAPAPAHP